MDGRNPPLTPSSAAAWKSLNAIHSAQDRNLQPQSMEDLMGGGSGGGGAGGFGEHHQGKRPTPVSVNSSSPGGLHKNLMKNRMDKLTGGSDPREPSTEAPRTPIGPGHKEYAEDLPRTPSSQDAWTKLNRIAAAQERQAHHPIGESENLATPELPWDPREPDQPRTPVHHAPVGGFPIEDPFQNMGAMARPLITSVTTGGSTTITAGATTAGGSSSGVGSGSGSNTSSPGADTTRVHIRIEQVIGVKSMHDPTVEVDLLDEDRKTSLHHAITGPADSASNTHTWQPPAHMSLHVPLSLVGTGCIKFHVVGKKMIGHRDAGEVFIPVRALPICGGPPGSHKHNLLRPNGENAGTIEMAAYREC